MTGEDVSLELGWLDDMARSDDLHSALDRSLEAAMAATGMSGGGIYLLTATGGLRLVAHRGLPERFVESVAHYPPDSANARLVREGQPVFASYDQLMQALGAERLGDLRASAVLPMVVGHTVVGAVNLTDHRIDALSSEQQSAARAVVSFAAQVIARERALRHERDQLRDFLTVFDTIPDYLFIVGEQGQILRVNDAVRDDLGYTDEQLLGQPVLIMHPPDLREKAARIVQAMVQGKVDVCPIPLQRTDGTLVPVETRVQAGTWNEKPALFGVSRNMSEQLRSQAELERAHARYRALFENEHLVALLIDPATGCVEDANPAAVAFYGHPRAQLCRMRIQDINVLGDHAVQEEMDRARAQARHLFHFRHRLASGEQRDVEVYSGPVEIDGKQLLYSVVFDATRQRALEAHEKRLERRVRVLQQRQNLGTLAGGLAHDVNNVLTVAMGNAEILAAELDGDLSSLAAEIVGVTHRARSLTEELLAFAGQSQPDTASVAVAELLRGIPGARDGVILHLPAGAPMPMVRGDVQQLHRVLRSIVANGCEALPASGGNVWVSVDEVVLGHSDLAEMVMGSTIGPGPCVVVEVRDDGEGMSEEQLERAVEPFYTTRFAGRGLGLSAALGIIQSHQGGLRIVSARGEGTVVQLFLPRGEPRLESPDAEAHATPRRPILVVDDEPALRRMLERLLQREGYEVVLAQDGQAALDRFDELGGDFELVILDLTMPVRDGASTLQGIRERAPDLPVVIMSGYREDHAASRLTGISGAPPRAFLHKPFSRSELRSAVELAAARLPVAS